MIRCCMHPISGCRFVNPLRSRAFIMAHRTTTSTTSRDEVGASSSPSSSSVTGPEVDKFNAMHAEWWDASRNPLISMNETRVGYIVDQVRGYNCHQNVSGGGGGTADHHHPDQPLHNMRALDVGCGGGLLTESLARLGGAAANVVGVDPSADLIAAAQQHAQLDERTRAIDYRHCTIEQVNEDECFDIVCLLEVIEHVPQPDSMLAAIARVLKPHGLLFVSTLNRTMKSYVLSIVGAEYIMRYLPPGTHDWKLYKSPTEVDRLCQPHGLALQDATGMVLRRPPWPGMNFAWKLAPHDTDVNWIGTFQKIR